MIMADTSVWVDHLRASDKALVVLLDAGMVLAHPFVIGELALGNLRQREFVLKALAARSDGRLRVVDEASAYFRLRPGEDLLGELQLQRL